MGPMRFGDNDVQGLHDLCKELIKPGFRVAEIGSYWGESAGIFANYAKLLYCIDPWVDVVEVNATSDGSNFEYEEMAEAEARFDLHVGNLKNIIKIRSYSDAVAEVLADRTFDLVYIDSLHPYEHVRRDIDRWWRIVKGGGWLAGHNHDPYWPGVIKAVAESFGKPDKTYKDTSWAVQKRQGRRIDG